MPDNYNEPTGIQFNLKVNNPSIIKVVGVGGGGGNAVTHMFSEGIHDVTYVLCNTDNKALTDSPVPNKLQMGEGLGAGTVPRWAARLPSTPCLRYANSLPMERVWLSSQPVWEAAQALVLHLLWHNVHVRWRSSPWVL
jgi:hypothetical protein